MPDSPLTAPLWTARKFLLILGALYKDTEDIRIYIDKGIAHREKTNLESGPRPEATWEDLDRLFHDIETLFNKYYDLVNPGVRWDHTPTLPHGFEQAFERMMVPISSKTSLVVSAPVPRSIDCPLDSGQG